MVRTKLKLYSNSKIDIFILKKKNVGFMQAKSFISGL